MNDFDDFFSYVPKCGYGVPINKKGNYYQSYYERWCNNKPDVKKAYKDFLNKIYGTSINDIPYVDHIQVNGDITTVIWKDGTHTIVKKAADDEYDIQTAIVYAIVKKMTGNTSGSLNRYMDSLSDKIVIKNKKSSTFMETLRTILPYLSTTNGKKVNDEEETFFEE